MTHAKTNLLIVDDDSAIRQVLSEVFAEAGYKVRTAEDGFSGLAEFRTGSPDLILSDLNMPGMSGFEFLSVVRRRFPTVYAIAMSGAYSGDAVPPGIVADAFYEKGTGLPALLRIMESMSRASRARLLHPHGDSAPIWIPGNGHNPSGEPFVVVTCTECLRTFAHVLGEASSAIQETSCVYCRSVIRFAIVEPALSAVPPHLSRKKPSMGALTPIGIPKFY